MQPYLLQLEHPDFWLRSYPTLIGLAVLVCFTIGPRWAALLEGLDRRAVRNVMLVLCAATFLGGHVHYVINAWAMVAARWATGDLSPLLWSGLHAPGAIVGLVLSGGIALRWWGIPPGKFGDALTPTVGVGIAIARVGCFLQGCCYGTPCAWPWCITFPEGSFAWNQHRFLRLIEPDMHHSAPVHPLQLYFSAAGLLITITALWLYPRKRYDGQVALVGVLIFSATSALLENLRAPFSLRAYWGNLPQLTWMLLAMTFISLLSLVAAEIRHRRSRIPLPAS